MRLIFITILLASNGRLCYCSGLFESADEIFESVIGDVYETRKRINNTDMRIFFEAEESSVPANASNVTFVTSDKSVTTTPGPAITTIKYFDPSPDMTMEYRRKIKMKLTLEYVLNTNHTMPDFSKDMGDTSKLTKVFDTISKTTRRQDTYHVYHSMGPRFYVYPSKIRVLSLMSHFVYATRYKLVIAQILRKRHLETFQFKIGYCFGLLRELKRKQKVIYSVWEYHKWDFGDILTYMNFYEKIVRLDVDIRDVLELLKSLVRSWKLQTDPEYYDHPLKEGIDNLY